MTQDLHVKLEFGDGAAESVAVHAQLACGLTLVALIFLQYGKDESLLELADRFRVENPAFVHLQYQGFQLIFHSASLLAFHEESHGDSEY